MKKYTEDLQFMASCGVEGVELTDPVGDARIFLVPAWQGRVMTSTAAGGDGASFGWINRALLASGQTSRQFNPVGGEERFWLGPEGGQFSFYFAPDAEQVFENWQVPAALDTEPFDVVGRTPSRVRFGKALSLVNASGRGFEIGVDRVVELLSRSQIAQILSVALSDQVQAVAYSSRNGITNRGQSAWTSQTGAPSVWMLGMFPPSDATAVVLPYKREGEGVIVNSGYFGGLSEDRLSVADGVICFRCDGAFRSKIGLPAGRDSGLCGSYDAAEGVLTLVLHTPSKPGERYVDSRWGAAEPYGGDVVNAYNDGPTDTGEVMGPFYEIETSSAAAFLKPGETLWHEQQVFHLQGAEPVLNEIVESLFGIGIPEIKKYIFES